jgi:radical SAM superfamily enzyme YgiQ (UPF0313 family)
MVAPSELVQIGTPPKPGEKLRVTLVRGPIVFGDGAVNNEATPAIAYAYISAYLKKQGYDPVVVDAIGEGLNRTWPLENYPGFNCHGLTFEEVIDRIPGDTEVIGFSAMFSGEWPVLRDLVMAVRKKFPDALFVAGGEHITAMTEFSLRDCPALDVCVRGEGEHIFYEILEARSETGGFENVDGIGFLDSSGSYRENGGLPRIRDIDAIPWPDWPEGYLEKFWEAGKSYGVGTERDMPFMISRGCPYRCTFCSNEQMWTTRYILRDVEDVIREVKHHIGRYDITAVQLYDLTAITKKRWLAEFANRLIEEGIKLQWSLPSGTRSEALDREGLSHLRKIGCVYLVYAPESGSPRTLELIKKRIDLANLTESVMEAKRQGFVVRINLIIGFPSETLKDIFQTLWYGLRMAARGVDEVPFNIYSPYPGTEIYKELLEGGNVELNDDYFFSLTSLNSAYFAGRVVSHNHRIGSRTLKFVRLFFILANYAISYLLYPHRIFRTLRNLFRGGSESSTVFEHRLKDLFKRRRTAA